MVRHSAGISSRKGEGNASTGLPMRLRDEQQERNSRLCALVSAT